jgi:hypothetical protein
MRFRSQGLSMANSEKPVSGVVTCGHCNNRAPMKIVATHSQVESKSDSTSNESWDLGDVYELLLCPSCNKVTLRKYFWHEMMEPDEISIKLLYPVDKSPLGLPASIQEAYDDALQVRTVNVNAYAVLIGRVLEMVCDDRNAAGKDLYAKLHDLAIRGEIPDKLLGIANSLRNLRNVGAHASLGKLTKTEAPILDDLCKAILEYVYSAPFLAKQAEDRLEQLKKVNQIKKGVVKP